MDPRNYTVAQQNSWLKGEVQLLRSDIERFESRCSAILGIVPFPELCIDTILGICHYQIYTILEIVPLPDLKHPWNCAITGFITSLELCIMVGVLWNPIQLQNCTILVQK